MLLGGRKRVCLLHYATAADTLLVQAGPLILYQRIVYKTDEPSPTLLQATTCLQLTSQGRVCNYPNKTSLKHVHWTVFWFKVSLGA